MNERKREERRPDAPSAPPSIAKSAKAGPVPERTGESPAGEELDLRLERIDTEGVLKEGFAGQEM